MQKTIKITYYSVFLHCKIILKLHTNVPFITKKPEKSSKIRFTIMDIKFKDILLGMHTKTTVFL